MPSPAAATAAAIVTAGNAADGSVAEALVDEAVAEPSVTTPLDVASSSTERMEIYGDASYERRSSSKRSRAQVLKPMSRCSHQPLLRANSPRTPSMST